MRLRTATARALVLITTGSAASCTTGDGEPHPAAVRQSAERVRALSHLDVGRAGRVRLRVFDLDQPMTAPPSEPVTYTFRAPTSTVEDADIRGYLDGETKYLFNQGTSYHMRVGRRYGGPIHNEFELKRSLVRWSLPRLPSGAEVVSAEVGLWVESFFTNSPLADQRKVRPLHLYAYPVETDWSAGRGGVGQDDFSEPARGEVSWIAAHTDSVSWRAPGVLVAGDASSRERYTVQPVAAAEIVASDQRVQFGGERLTRYLRRRLGEQRPFDLLLKLDDQEEDRWGTELAFLSSDFGDDRDIESKRPTLEIDVRYPFRAVERRWPFVLEAGQETELPVVRIAGAHTLAAIDVTVDGPDLAPVLYARGGRGQPADTAPWRRLTGPLDQSWDWIQLKVSAAPQRIEWGDTFVVRLQETWVQPGPRDEQRPELVLIAPSGAVHRVRGQPTGNLHYAMQFQPTELGLWRYGWSFRPTPVRPPGSHQGEGLFYVSIPAGEVESSRLKRLADQLRSEASDGNLWSAAFQARLNNLIRWAARHGQRSPAAKRLSDSLVTSVRGAIQ